MTPAFGGQYSIQLSYGRGGSYSTRSGVSCQPVVSGRCISGLRLGSASCDNGPMASAYLVSDIHIVTPTCPRAVAFLRFLGSLSGTDASHLVLLGDIFDLWVADHRYFIERYRDIIDEIRRLRNEGVEIHYFEGNHDLHLRYFWAEQLGLTVHGEASFIELGNPTVRLEHGDQMDPDDKGYLFLRRFLRNGVIRFLVRNLPGRLIAGIGERASEKSRHYTSTAKSINDSDAIAKIRTHAEKVFAERPFDLIVSGHVHVRDDWQPETGEFRSVNLGSWLDKPCYFRIDRDSAGFHELEQAAPENVAESVNIVSVS